MADYVTIKKVKIPYNVETKILYADGKTALVNGKVTNSIATTVYPITVTPPVTTPVQPPNTGLAVTRIKGNGKELNLGNITNQHIILEPCTQGYINIGRAVNCVLELTGVDMPKGTIDIESAEGLEIFGQTMHDQPYRCINFNGLSNGVYLHDIVFRNVGDYSIKNNNQVYWTGADASACKNWKMERLTFDNTSTCFNSDSSFDAAGVKNLMKDLTIKDCIIKNCPTIGNAFYIGACDGYLISGNTFNNINSENNDDNGMFLIYGTGAIFNNKLTNHEGYLIRSRTMSFGPEVKTVLMYNNMVYNSRKYSALEVQTTPEMAYFITKYPKLANFAKTQAYGNVVGKLSTSRDWAGVLFVAYNTYEPIEVSNNTAFDLFNTEQDPAKLIHGMNDPGLTPIISKNNTYYKTAALASLAIPSVKALTA
jgi:hypothetical protein